MLLVFHSALRIAYSPRSYADIIPDRSRPVFQVERDYGAGESFNAEEYLGYLRRRLKFILLVCAGAGVLALGISLLLPKQYTATARIAIDPPAGDPRASISVSPIYLESLKAYQLLASGDTLFLDAAEKFHLRQNAQPIEALKRKVLKVTLVPDTKVLEIAATLRDPGQAEALAQYIAGQTVALSRDANLEGDRDLAGDGEKRLQAAQIRLDREQAAWRDFSTREPYESMRAELETLTGSQERVNRDLLDSRAELAELKGSADDGHMAGVQARVDTLAKQDAELSREIQAKGAALSGREAQADQMEQRLRSARTEYDAAAARLGELRAAEGSRGERLRVMDPGVTPERPSSPNVALNVLLALAAALLASVVYLTLTFRPHRP